MSSGRRSTDLTRGTVGYSWGIIFLGTCMGNGMDPPSPERQAAMDRAVGKRNEVECSFGTGKRVYQANDIRAKLPETAECWTGMCYFAKNVMKFFRELCHDFIELLKFITMVDAWRHKLATAICANTN